MHAVIWSKITCPTCTLAKELLQEKGIQFDNRIIGESWTKEDLLKSVPNAKTVPQIFIDNTYVGGYNELVEFFNSQT